MSTIVAKGWSLGARRGNCLKPKQGSTWIGEWGPKNHIGGLEKIGVKKQKSKDAVGGSFKEGKRLTKSKNYPCRAQLPKEHEERRDKTGSLINHSGVATIM